MVDDIPDKVLEKKDELKKKIPQQTRSTVSEALNKRDAKGNLIGVWAATGVVLAAAIWGWWFFLPLTYGKPGLTVDQVQARKWLGYDLHFAK